MKFRIIFESDELTVITEDGGIACIREAEEVHPNTPRVATTDYYQMRLTEIPANKQDELYECLAEGKMYYEDWKTQEFNSLTVIQDALSWLVVGETNWELSDDLFPEFFDVEEDTKSAIIPIDHLNKIAGADAFELLDMVLETPALLSNNYILNVIKSRNKKLASGELA